MPNAISPNVTLFLVIELLRASSIFSHIFLRQYSSVTKRTFSWDLSVSFNCFENLCPGNSKIDENGPGRETTCVLQKVGIFGSFFLCIISFPYTEIFRKSWNQTSWARGFRCIWNVLKTSPLKIQKFSALRNQWKIVIIPKNPAFFKTCVLIWWWRFFPKNPFFNFSKFKNPTFARIGVTLSVAFYGKFADENFQSRRITRSARVIGK